MPTARPAPQSSPSPGRTTGRGGRAALTMAVVWLAGMGMLQWSVVRFRPAIVLVLTGCAVALAWWQAARVRVVPTRITTAVVLVGYAVLAWAVPTFSYLPPAAERWVLGIATGYALLSAALLWLAAATGDGERRSGMLPLAVAGLGAVVHVASAAIAIRTDRAPRIDVWVFLQQAADVLGRGENMYAAHWTGSPGVRDAFPYLPWTEVLLAPGRWLLGDVRWAMLVWSLVLYAGLWVLATGTAHPRGGEGSDDDDEEPVGSNLVQRRWVAAFAIAVLAVAPGQLTQIDQVWTEPLLAAGLVWWAALVRRGHPWWAVIPLAVTCACKQHLAVVLPLLLLWRRFGPARTVATGALAVALMSPWILADPGEFLNDTVTLFLKFPAFRFANTLYLLALNVFHVTLPFWVTGLAVLGTLGGAGLLIWRRQPGLGELLRWVSLVLLVANLVNKQAFYNQFWLCAALVVMSLAAEAGQRRPAPADERATVPSAVPLPSR